MTTQATGFQVERSNLTNWRVVQDELAEPLAGEVLMRVDRFALTANNITYGVAGDSIGYWQFFPAPQTWGNIPVWGFADVEISNHPEIAVGERFYGYYPMATHLMVKPEKVSVHGFVDGVAHRAQLPAVYNQYVNVAADPNYSAAREAQQVLYRPLFTTSFFLDDFLLENDFFGAARVILTSASSKTAIGLAHILHSKRRELCRVIGLTSSGNKSFVSSLGCYDEVVSYDEIGSLSREAAVMVDIAGGAGIRRAVHGRLQDLLRYSCAVGATHWDDASISVGSPGGNGGGNEALPGPEPVMFFAPTQIQKRARQWGRDLYDEKTGAAWQDFLAASQDWISVEVCEGVEALGGVYDAFLAGRADPARGYVVSI